MERLIEMDLEYMFLGRTILRNQKDNERFHLFIFSS
jgi:hypothetical protein